VKIIYAFPEPLPLDRARGLQAVSTVAAMGRAGIEVDFAFVPVAGVDPFTHYGLSRPAGVTLIPIARSLSWPLSRLHSNRLFFANLRRHFGDMLYRRPLMVRHLKLAALIVERLPGASMLYEAHEVFGDTAAAGKRETNRALERSIMARAQAVVANSGATACRLKELYPAPAVLEVVPNGVDRPVQLPDKPWTEARRHVIYAGSFFPWKGATELVRAAAGLPGYRITLVGGDEARIRELGSGVSSEGAELIFAGHLPHAQVMSRLSAACIAVLPNRDDTDSSFTSPIKLFEYMAAGCAIVASDLPALREILTGEEAVWVQPGDPEALAAGIRRLGEDALLATRMGQRVREKSTRYTWDARANRLISLLQAFGQRQVASP
jgi:glycosyltransferase involved in cell wall biosynthesis